MMYPNQHHVYNEIDRSWLHLAFLTLLLPLLLPLLLAIWIPVICHYYKMCIVQRYFKWDEDDSQERADRGCRECRESSNELMHYTYYWLCTEWKKAFLNLNKFKIRNQAPRACKTPKFGGAPARRARRPEWDFRKKRKGEGNEIKNKERKEEIHKLQKLVKRQIITIYWKIRLEYR